jgi:hypothetical protein
MRIPDTYFEAPGVQTAKFLSQISIPHPLHMHKLCIVYGLVTLDYMLLPTFPFYMHFFFFSKILGFLPQYCWSPRREFIIFFIYLFFKWHIYMYIYCMESFKAIGHRPARRWQPSHTPQKRLPGSFLSTS